MPLACGNTSEVVFTPPHCCTGMVHRVNVSGADMLHMYCTVVLGHNGPEQL